MLKPLKDRVLIKRLEEDQKTSGGLIIPDTAKEKPAKGEVIAIGKGETDSNGNTIPMEVKVGDKVLFEKWSGNEIKIDDQEFVIVKEIDIMGIL